MDTIDEAILFLKIKLNSMTQIERIEASKEAKVHILNVYEIYKKNNTTALKNLMKSIIILKRNIDESLK